MTVHQFQIIDSHIHLYAATHLSTLNWAPSLPDGHILKQQRSVDDYRKHYQNCRNLMGFIFVETDRRFSNDANGWRDPLDEVRFLVRIAQGQPVSGEGHVIADSHLVLGIVPWAPVAGGPDALISYVSQVEQICANEETFSLIKGFRYLLQDKPPMTMLRPEFVSGLNWLGNHNFVFDLGLDTNSGGLWQLAEGLALLTELHRLGSSLRIVINHFCKPDFYVGNDDDPNSSREFLEWAVNIRSFASFPHTFMKLSGFFSELEAQTEGSPASLNELSRRVKPWVDVVFEAFTPSRIMFGSDWPVCTANGPGALAWQHWHDLVSLILNDRGLSEDEKKMVWSGTAIKAYNIQTPS